MILENLAACLLVCRTRSSPRRGSRPQGSGMTERLVELGLRPELLRLQGELTGRPQKLTVTNPWTTDHQSIFQVPQNHPKRVKMFLKVTQNPLNI